MTDVTSAPLHLAKAAEATFSPGLPFHFDGTFYKPSHFPSCLSSWAPGHFHQTLWVGEKLLGVQFTDRPTAQRPEVALQLFSSEDLSAREVTLASDELRYRYDLDADLSEFSRLMSSDSVFAPTFENWRGTRASTQYSLYELLVVGVLLQNTTVRRSVQMLDALVSAYGREVSFGGVTLQSLWRPAELDHVDESELRRLRIGYRSKALKRFSSQFSLGEFDERALRALDDTALRRCLLRIYGVGPETVRILLTEAFHRHDTFHHIAPWQQKIYSQLFYGEPLVAADTIIEDINRAYGRWASLAIHYIWEDIFWRRRHTHVDWLEKEIRL